jgi:hypothetical protein
LCGEHAEELRAELTKCRAELSKWTDVFGHLGTPDQVGNLWHDLNNGKHLKDHEIREMINSLRDIACRFHNHQSLRERIAHVVLDAMKRNASNDKN